MPVIQPLPLILSRLPFRGLVTDAADNPLSDAIVRITSPQPERVTVNRCPGQLRLRNRSRLHYLIQH